MRNFLASVLIFIGLLLTTFIFTAGIGVLFYKIGLDYLELGSDKEWKKNIMKD